VEQGPLDDLAASLQRAINAIEHALPKAHLHVADDAVQAGTVGELICKLRPRLHALKDIIDLAE
jgi:hypothetical protein